jgi:hypothetical protein
MPEEAFKGRIYTSGRVINGRIGIPELLPFHRGVTCGIMKLKERFFENLGDTELSRTRKSDLSDEYRLERSQITCFYLPEKRRKQGDRPREDRISE